MKKVQPNITNIFDAYCEAYSNSDQQLLQSALETPVDELIRKNKQAAYDFLQNDISIKKKVIWLNKLYSDCNLKDYNPLLALLKDNSKLIRRSIEKIIINKEKRVRPILEQMYPELDEELQNWARQIIKYWDYTHASGTKARLKNKQAVIDYCSKHIELHCTQQIAWLPLKPYTRIHWAGETDQEEFVPRHVIRFVLSEYMSVPQPIRLHICDTIVSFIDEKEWQAALEELFRIWVADGEEAKRRTILLPYCMYASERQIFQLQPMIRRWSKTARKLVTKYIFGLLGLRASMASLIILNDWMELSPSNLYKWDAWKAFRQVAIRKKLTIEELADRIIPNFGFNRQGEREVDYGSRILKVTLKPDFSISVFDVQKQKVSKSMPAPKKEDDQEKANQAREEFGDMASIVKRQSRVQRKRLEQVLKNKRTWPKDKWQAIFIENPVMRYMAAGLIWGIYKEGELLESFRYTENGTFITINETPFTLPEEAVISLVHPIDLTDEALAKWKKQLNDQKIDPLLPQLDIPVHRLSDTEKQGDILIRYSGKSADFGNLYKFDPAEFTFRTEEESLYLIDRSLNVVIQHTFIREENNYQLKELHFSSLLEGEDIYTMQLPRKENLPLESLPDRFISHILDTFIKVFNLE